MYDERPIALYVSLLLPLIAIRETQWFRLRGRGRRRSQAPERVDYIRESPGCRGRRRFEGGTPDLGIGFESYSKSVHDIVRYCIAFDWRLTNTERILYTVLLLCLVSYIFIIYICSSDCSAAVCCTDDTNVVCVNIWCLFPVPRTVY